MLKSTNILRKPEDLTPRGRKNIDGAIVEALVNQSGYVELIHNPSLVWHSGHGRSTLGNSNPQGSSFPGADYDARRWIKPGR